MGCRGLGERLVVHQKDREGGQQEEEMTLYPHTDDASITIFMILSSLVAYGLLAIGLWAHEKWAGREFVRNLKKSRSSKP